MLIPKATYLILFTGFLLFFFLVWYSSKKHAGDLYSILKGRGKMIDLFFHLAAGIFILGGSVLLIVAAGGFETSIFTFPPVGFTSLPWILIAGLAVITGWRSAIKRYSATENEHLLLPGYFPGLFMSGRIVFLIIYEYFFRGVLLFLMIPAAGVIPAILVNIILYMLAHWFGNKEEKYGSILMGLVLCCVSIYYHSIWPAIIIHLMLAMSHEITALQKNQPQLNT